MASTETKLIIDTSDAMAQLEDLLALAAKVSLAVGAATDVKRFAYQPGDTIVVRVDQVLSSEMVSHITRYMQDTVGSPDAKVMVLGKGMTIDVLVPAA